MKWQDFKKTLTSITPEETRVLEDLAIFTHFGYVNDEGVEKAIDDDMAIELRNDLMNSHKHEYIIYRFKKELDSDINKLTKHINECKDDELKSILETKKKTMCEIVSKLDAWKRRTDV